MIYATPGTLQLLSYIHQRGQLSYSNKKPVCGRERGQTDQDTRKRDKVTNQTEQGICLQSQL
jgi:hypothetical protein